MLKQKNNDDSKSGVSMRVNPWIVLRAATVHFKALFAAIHKFTICSALALSVATTGLSGVLIIGLSSPSHAGSGDPACEKANAPSSCDEPTGGSKKKIEYTIWNDSDRTVHFQLPSGKKYTLKPDRRGRYHYTTNGHLKMYVYNTEKTYTLKSGNHKFWWSKKKERIAFHSNYD